MQEVSRASHLRVTHSSGPLCSMFTLLEAYTGARVKGLKCCVPLPGDKTFPWVFFLKVMFFIMCLLLIYLECSIQCLPRKEEKYLNVLNRTGLYPRFTPKETLPHFSGIYSWLSTEGTKRCISITKTLEEEESSRGWEPATQSWSKPCSRTPDTEGAPSRSRSLTEDGKRT